MENERDRVWGEISRYSPVPWESIPDLGLYMDQVITFITRAYEPLYGESTKGYLSAPMINNYVKNKLIPRPSGKKYSRMQIAMLIMIVSLKRVCMMEDIRAMISVEDESDVQQLYAQFCARQQQAIQQRQHLRCARHIFLRRQNQRQSAARGNRLAVHPLLLKRKAIVRHTCCNPNHRQHFSFLQLYYHLLTPKHAI